MTDELTNLFSRLRSGHNLHAFASPLSCSHSLPSGASDLALRVAERAFTEAPTSLLLRCMKTRKMFASLINCLCQKGAARHMDIVEGCTRVSSMHTPKCTYWIVSSVWEDHVCMNVGHCIREHLSLCGISGRLKVGMMHLHGQQVQHILITGARLPKTQNKMGWCLGSIFHLAGPQHNRTYMVELLPGDCKRFWLVVLLGQLMLDNVSQACANNNWYYCGTVR